MPEEDPDLLAGDNLDKLRGRNPYPAMSERYRLTEELENARYQNNLLIEKCRQIEMERDEARRLLCEEWAKQDGLPLDWQGRRGAEGMAEFVKWDCFKENNND